jgi:cellulose synthase/poly-beta-1,6-N-acetylglucosamine synthase-like glycosyltransferase
MILMLVVILSFLFIFTMYFAVFMKIWYGWKSITDDTVSHSGIEIRISVVIAARNEEHSLSRLVDDLKNQTYSKDLYDVIIVDDHSQKKISELPFIENIPDNFIVYTLPEDEIGKKRALLYGAKKSKAELLLFTDADCRLHPEWVNTIANKYTNEKPGLIIGLVDYFPDQGLLKQFFRFDFISLVITGAGTSYLGKHTLCNGANLAVKKDLYINLADKLHPEIPSGDDVFLIHEIKKNTKETISVLKSKHSVVKTQPPCNLYEFIEQRIRWASKGRYYSDSDTIFLSFLVLITNIVVILSVFLCFIYPSWAWFFISLIILKSIADGFILGSGLKYFDNTKKLWLLPLFEIIYPIYMLSAATGGLLNAFHWKSRKG